MTPAEEKRKAARRVREAATSFSPEVEKTLQEFADELEAEADEIDRAAASKQTWP